MLKLLGRLPIAIAIFGLIIPFSAFSTDSLPKQILTLEGGMEACLERGESPEVYRSILNTWYELTARLRIQPEILEMEIAGARGREKDALLSLRVRIGMSAVPSSSVAQFRPRTSSVQSVTVNQIAPAVQLLPHFDVDELVLTEQGDVARVIGMHEGKVVVHGRVSGYGQYSPRVLTKEADGPVQGVEVGSHVWTEKNGWAKVARVWQDGRIEVNGKWYLPTPYEISEFEKIVPPKPHWFVRMTDSIYSFCERLLKSTKPVVF